MNDLDCFRHDCIPPTRRERLTCWLRNTWGKVKSGAFDALIFWSGFWVGVLTGIVIGIMLMAWAAGRMVR